MVGLTHSFAKALGPKGIRVNAISPGVIDTPDDEVVAAAAQGWRCSETPLGRLAVPHDVASVACFLVSETPTSSPAKWSR